ncbi:MAG: hypothetical protein D4R74_11950 [Betaproteobacteria bacterium]|nr:MAG: hypothetical protein D4R74_11950 [Betaproteobacteria bacterium]
MNAESKGVPGTLEELAGVATAARDAMTEDIIGRVADSAAGAMDLMDKVNRSGLSKAIPQLAQMVENGDLQRLVNLARVYGSAEDALTEEMVGRIAGAASDGLSLMDQVNRSGLEKALPTLTRLVADGDIERLAQLARVYGAAQDAMSDEIIGRLSEAMSEGLSLLDRLNRGGAGRLVEMLAKLEASGSLERVAALLPTFVDRLEMVGGLLESMETAAKQAEAERTDGGIVAMYRMLTDVRTQETLRFMLALGQNMHERYARKS